MSSFFSTSLNVGWAWAWWLLTDVQRCSLEVMTLNPVCENVETKQGVPLTVTGVAQVRMIRNMFRPTLLEKFWRISLYVADDAMSKLYVT